MNDGIEIIHQNPAGIAGTLDMRRRGVHFFLHLFINAVGNRFDVGAGVAFANNEKICGGISEAPQVQQHDVFALLIPDPFDNLVIELFGVEVAGFDPLGCCKIQKC